MMTIVQNLRNRAKKNEIHVEDPEYGNSKERTTNGEDEKSNPLLNFCTLKCMMVLLLLLLLRFRLEASALKVVSVMGISAESPAEKAGFTEKINFCPEDAIQTYIVCNGFSNQLLGHAGFISNLIEQKKAVTIPDAFIYNGVQNERNGRGQRTLKNVVANEANSIPLTSIIDGNMLLKTIRSYGVDACFIPYERVISNEEQTMECSWLAQLQESDNDIEFKVLYAMKPSTFLSEIVETTFSNLVGKSSKFDVSDGVCLHHRDGADWHKHCNIWQGNNCMNLDGRNIEDLVKDRIPPAYKKKWMYYIGDVPPSENLTEAMLEGAGLHVYNRANDKLLNEDELRKVVGSAKLSLEEHRDIFAAVDFFVCSHIPSFIGNSVSTFSALQIAKRHGKNCTWYNSRSNPLLADFMQVQEIPIVYTYTEASAALGKALLKASIISVRQTFGMGVDVNIIYHGTEDKVFLGWLAERNVIIHNHEPEWLPMIDIMIANADQQRSHLYSHRGNYIGTWQRIDIPLFIDAEYAMFLDADTIVHEKFDLSTFGLEITPGIAFSNEFMEKDKRPSNAGVALFNVPLIRNTHKDFMDFVRNHADRKKDFILGPSDQGAYLDFYHSYKQPGVRLNHEPSKYMQHLDTTFNVKPYYKLKKNFDERKVIHYHGLKPHEILKGLMGYKSEQFSPALRGLLPMMFGHNNHHFLCLTLHDFAAAMVADEDNLIFFCNFAFFLNTKEETACKDFLKELSTKNENENCVDILKSYGFKKDDSYINDYMVKCDEAEELYLNENPEVKIATERRQFSSGFQHWRTFGIDEGKTYSGCPTK